jgi:hypothetical protein
MKGECIEYQERSLPAHRAFNEQKSFSPIARLNQVLSWIIESIIATNEIKIYSPRNRFGNYWVVYDPMLGRRVFFDSATEVRSYLDRRYYQ